MRGKFDRQLQQLNEEMTRMGNMIEQAIQTATQAFLNQDVKTAREIMEGDAAVDEAQKRIESICFQLLIQQQPVAKDLRTITAALKMVTDMERIGDHAADISELTLMLRELPAMSNAHLREMAAQTTQMLLSSLEAYVSQDMEKANAVIAQDDAVDALFVAVKNDLVAAILADPKAGETAADLLMAAKYFERIGDHATNIAEWAIFAHTGHHAGEGI